MPNTLIVGWAKFIAARGGRLDYHLRACCPVRAPLLANATRADSIHSGS